MTMETTDDDNTEVAEDIDDPRIIPTKTEV